MIANFDVSFFFDFQDCHIKTHSSSGEPVLDGSQDYVLLTSSENATHTILRFRRKLDTCDEKFDVPITVRVNNLLQTVLSQIIQKKLLKTQSSGTFEDKGNMPLIMYEF